jgi:hypothetical protein
METVYQVYHKTLADIVKGVQSRKSASSSKQNRRQRRLHDQARHIAAAMKEYEQKLELSMRRANDLKAHIVLMAEEDVVDRMEITRSMLRGLASLSNKVLENGVKQKFDMVSLQKSRVRNMLRQKIADAAFEALSTPRLFDTLPNSDSPETLGAGGDRTLSITTYMSAKRAARQMIQTMSFRRGRDNKDGESSQTLQALWAQRERHVLSKLQEAEPKRTATYLKALESFGSSFKKNDRLEAEESGRSRVMEWHSLMEATQADAQSLS